MLEAVCDNDVVFKLARWELLDNFCGSFKIKAESIGVLGSLPYVIGPRLSRLARPGAETMFQAFIDIVTRIEPEEHEVQLAAVIEEASLASNAEIDAGESLMIAVALLRNTKSIITGDKRAIVGLSQLSKIRTQLIKLKGRLISLEQIIALILKSIGADTLRDRICSDEKCDRALSICFACRQESASADTIIEALKSYQRDLWRRSDGFCSERLAI